MSVRASPVSTETTVESRRQPSDPAGQRRLELISAVWSIVRQRHLDVSAKIDEVLRVGCAMFGEKLGILASIDDDRYVVINVHSTSGGHPEPGTEFPLGRTVCAITMEADGPVAVSRMSQSVYRTHPSLEEHDVESYIGTAITVGNRIYGTLSFSSDEPVENPFLEIDREFVGMLGEWIGGLLAEDEERRQLTDTLRERIEFLATTNHELRSPIAGVRGLSDVLLSGVHGALSDVQTDLIHKARDASDHLLTLIDDLSDLIRIDSGAPDLEPAVVRVRDSVDAAITFVQPLADEGGHRITVSAGPGIPVVVGDGRRLTQIVVNLLSNAIKFTPDPGTIEVSIGHSGGSVTVAVTDPGVGIPADKLEAVFERYRQLGTPGKGGRGSGLGLALSKELAHLHGGDLEVASRYGVGSTFTLRLPAGTRAA